MCIQPLRSFLTCIQLIEFALQLFKLLPGLAESACRRQSLVVGEVFGSFRDECVTICRGLGRLDGSGWAPPRSHGASTAHRRSLSAEQSPHRGLERGSVCEPVL